MTDFFFRHDKYRKGQKELIDGIYDVVSKGKFGLFEAPTGLGKTDAALSATLAYALENKKKVFFVTPKTSQHAIVMDAIKGINEKHNMKIRAIDLVAKPNLCIDPFLYGMGPEFYELCEKKVSKNMCLAYLNVAGNRKQKTIRKIPDVDLDSFLSENGTALMSSEMRSVCMEKNYCPHELNLKMAKYANVLVVDVNHVFLPKIRQTLFAKGKIEVEDCIFIIDEAHNLPGRLRTSLSSALKKTTLESAVKEYNHLKKKKEMKNNIFDFLQDLSKLHAKFKDGFLNYTLLDNLFIEYDYSTTIEDLNDLGVAFTYDTNKKSNLASVANFLNMWVTSRETSTRFMQYDTAYVKGLDPGLLSKNLFDLSHASILMSATLSPFGMFQDILGLDKDRISISKKFESPFPPNNKIVSVTPDITTKYDERQQNIGKIASTIIDVLNGTEGNVAVFFPSYSFLETVLLKVQSKTMKKIFVQKQRHSNARKDKLISEFKQAGKSVGGALFAVAGGSFSEGVDFPGDELKGIIMVGLPFPEPDYEMKALIEYYDTLFKNGWDYAYLFPTINKVVQASGRAIRTSRDKAFILLLDKRYMWSKYRALFPLDFKFKKFDLEEIKEFNKGC
jgi:DNA excision repair protein ERCC-2